jgi:hypothetical protein
MVTIEISTIVYSFISIILAVVGVLIIRTLRGYDKKHEECEEWRRQHDERLLEIRSDFEHLLGEHDAITCKQKKKR